MPRTRYSEIFSKAVGARLRSTREELGLSQAEIAARLGVKQPYIAAVESGRVNPTVGQLGNIAAALGVGLDVNFPIPVREYRKLTATAGR